MATVSFWVEKIIEQKPFLEEMLRSEIINHAALAEKLIPEISLKLKKQVKFSAVNMAIRRLEEKLSEKNFNKPKFNKNTEITIKPNLRMVSLEKTQIILKKIKSIKTTEKEFLTITTGLNEIMLVSNSKKHEKLIKSFKKKEILDEEINLSALTISLPKNSKEIPGLIFLISRELSMNNISIVDIISTFSELTVLVKDNDVILSFEVLKNMISNKC